MDLGGRLYSALYSKTKETEPFGGESSEMHLGSQLAAAHQSQSKTSPLFLRVFAQGCCFPPAEGSDQCLGR